MDDNEEIVIQYLSDLVIRIVSKFALSYQFLKSIGFLKKIIGFLFFFVNKVNILLPSITIYANLKIDSHYNTFCHLNKMTFSD